MKELDYLKDMLCNEVKKITQQNDFTTSTLETAYKIVDMIKDIDEIQSKEESHQYEKDGSYGYWGMGYGGRMPYNDRYSYGNNGMGMNGGNNYGYDNGYSRMSSSDKMVNELQMMMEESNSARDKAIIQRALDELKK